MSHFTSNNTIQVISHIYTLLVDFINCNVPKLFSFGLFYVHLAWAAWLSGLDMLFSCDLVGLDRFLLTWDRLHSVHFFWAVRTFRVKDVIALDFSEVWSQNCGENHELAFTDLPEAGTTRKVATSRKRRGILSVEKQLGQPMGMFFPYHVVHPL